MGNKKTLCEWINHLHRVFLLSWKNFQRPQDAQPSPEGTILGAWGNPSTSIFAGAIRLKSQNMYMFALLAGFSYPVFLPFRAVFLQTRKEEAYTSSFSSSASFNLMAPSMTPSTMGRYFSGQSCNLWLVRWRCSLSSRSSSGLK